MVGFHRSNHVTCRRMPQVIYVHESRRTYLRRIWDDLGLGSSVQTFSDFHSSLWFIFEELRHKMPWRALPRSQIISDPWIQQPRWSCSNLEGQTATRRTWMNLVVLLCFAPKTPLKNEPKCIPGTGLHGKLLQGQPEWIGFPMAAQCAENCGATVKDGIWSNKDTGMILVLSELCLQECHDMPWPRIHGALGLRIDFDPQTGNLALSQPKIPMAVVCWVAVDPQPESPLRNREILCPRAVADSSELFLPCPKPQGLYTVFIFHVSAVPIPTHLHCVAPFFRLKNIWSPKKQWDFWQQTARMARVATWNSLRRWPWLELTEDRRISKVFRTCYAVDGPWGYTCLGKLTGLFHCWNMGIGQNWVPQCTPIIRCLIPNIY